MPAIKMQPPLEVDRRKFQFPIKRNRPMVHPQHTQRQFRQPRCRASVATTASPPSPRLCRGHSPPNKSPNPPNLIEFVSIAQTRGPSASTTQNAPCGSSVRRRIHACTSASKYTHASIINCRWIDSSFRKAASKENPISLELAIDCHGKNISNSGSGSAANSVAPRAG